MSVEARAVVDESPARSSIELKKITLLEEIQEESKGSEDADGAQAANNMQFVKAEDGLDTFDEDEIP